jgi:hypothetical protein
MVHSILAFKSFFAMANIFSYYSTSHFVLNYHNEIVHTLDVLNLS